MRRKNPGILSKLILLPIMLLTTLSMQATHIVGGELNYTNLGNDNYKLELKLYKDCGTSIVPFDNPATIYVYGGDDLFLASFEIPLVERDTLDAAFDDPCLVIPPDVCVDFAKYELVVNLPAIPDNYTLAFIRCCRNATILNAEGEDLFGNPLPPDLIGATYVARIPASPTINSNPVFNEFPPIIVCSGQPISVDQSAFDADGDQLVYSLCTPYVGGSLVNVFGDPFTERPPFEEIHWVDPFGLDNIMGGEPPLSIDPVTGQLSGQAPFTIGQFVVGVCVQEFRDGILLSENKRDFQFNIADCQELIVTDYEIEDEPYQDTLPININNTLFDYVLLCDTNNLAIQFYDLSMGADEVIWDFGDGSALVTEADPIHIFPDTGFYLVSLLSPPMEACVDTFWQLINVQLQHSISDFTFSPPQCYDPSSGLQFTDLTSAPVNIDSWSWNFGDGSSGAQQHPIHFYAGDGDYDVSLEILEDNGCRSTYETTISVDDLDAFSLIDTLSLCGRNSVLLELVIDGDHEYLWSPAATLSQSDIAEPLAFPLTNTVYTVEIRTIRDSGDTCLQEGRVVVLTDVGLPVINDITDPFQCDNPIHLGVDVLNEIEIIWSLDGGFQNVIGDEAEIDFFQEDDIEAYFIQATNYNCERRDTIIVEQRAINIEGDDVIACKGEEIAIRPIVSSLDPSYSYTWTPEGGQIDNSIPEYVFAPLESTEVTVDIINESGCRATRDFLIDISIISDLDVVAEPSVIVGETLIQFQATPSDSYDYAWQPAAVFDDPLINTPVALVSETSEFIVEVTDMNGCNHFDTVVITLLESCDEQHIFIPSAFSPNGDDLNDIFRIQSEILQSVTLQIFDRYGNMVFETTEISEGWDGRFQGSNLGNDVFGYILKVVCIGGEQYVKKGSVTLVR